MLMYEEQQQNASIHTAFVKALNIELAKQLFRPIDVQELQEPETFQQIWLKI